MFPDSKAIVREAVTVVAGAVLAAFVIGNLPMLKRWIKHQWES